MRIFKFIFILLSFSSIIFGEIFDIEVDKFYTLVRNQKNPIIIDVRTNSEFKTGHIQNAVNYDIYESNFINNFKNLNKNEPIFLYCRSGKRSKNAALILEENGFKTIYNLKGGIIKWQNKNKPTEK